MFSVAQLTGRLDCHTLSGDGASESKLDRLPDISMLSPELQQQWDVGRNMHLGPGKVAPFSHIKAVWQCNDCPAGQPHIWTAHVFSRTRGAQCPYCCNRLICLHNSLATVAPEVAQYWDHSKNKKSPQQVVAGSNYRAEWQCPACKWEWQARVGQRVCKRAGCPKCSHMQKVKRSQPTFAEAQPACLAEWDYECNAANGMYPNDLTLGSGKLVHWVCSCCPKGQPHRWTAMANNRTRLGSGCPFCAGQQACVCNSLESLVPSVAAEFDVDKNGFGPAEITAQSGEMVWWRNVKRGSWRQTPNSRHRPDKAARRKDQVKFR